MALCHREGASVKLQAISEWESFVERKRDGTVRRYDRPCESESVELERGGTVRGFDRHVPVADFDAHRLGRFCCCKIVSENWMEWILVHTSNPRRAN